MDKILTVAAREFLETVKSRMFIFSVIFMPLLIMGSMYGSERLRKMGQEEALPLRTIALVDPSGDLTPGLQAAVARHNQRSPQRPLALEVSEGPVEALRQRVNQREVYAYVVAPADVTPADAQFEFGRKGTDIEFRRQVDNMVNAAVTELRFKRSDPPLDLERVRALQQEVELREVDVATGQATGSQLAALLTPFMFMLFLFMGTINISQGLLMSLIEEKSTRVIELLLSAITPFQLMAGKILGMVAVGALLMAIWTLVGYASAATFSMSHLVTSDRLLYLALYFVPGFLLISAILAGVGAACNTIKDAQSLAFPVTIITIVPMLLWFSITQNPNSMLAVSLSFIPPLTPFIMILRICSDPEIPLVQIILSLVLLWVSVFAAIWAAAKIFRIGVLMYGKAPTPRELLRWLRYD